MQKISMNNFSEKRLLQGFVLPFTLLISVLILFITTGTLGLLVKQQYFSKLYRQNQVAYYAADDAISCATLIDDTYTGNDGIGIFPISSTSPNYINDAISYYNTKHGTTLSLDKISCSQSQIFADSVPPSFNPNFAIAATDYSYHYIHPADGSAYAGQPEIEYGQTSSYNMQMDLGLDPADITLTKHLYRCAKVTINKTPSFRQIIAQGYSSCNTGAGSVERAVVNTTIAQ
jgi:hypothetical protein